MEKMSCFVCDQCRRVIDSEFNKINLHLEEHFCSDECGIEYYGFNEIVQGEVKENVKTYKKKVRRKKQ
jgi:hypothetical protein